MTDQCQPWPPHFQDAQPLVTCCPIDPKAMHTRCQRTAAHTHHHITGGIMSVVAEPHRPVAETKRPPGAGCLARLPVSALPPARAPFQVPLALCCACALPPPLQQQQLWAARIGPSSKHRAMHWPLTRPRACLQRRFESCNVDYVVYRCCTTWDARQRNPKTCRACLISFSALSVLHAARVFL